MAGKTFKAVGNELVRVSFFDYGRWGDWMGRATKQGVVSEMNALTSNLTTSLAVEAMRKMSDVLSKKHSFRVGASGKASRNFRLTPIKDSNGVSFVAVTIGDETIANEKIREGMKPGSWPSIETLKKWASNKGWRPKSYYKPEKEAIASYSRTSKLGNVHTVKAYVKRKKGEKRKEEDDPYYLIGRAIYLHGTGEGRRNDPGPLWKRLYPMGEGRFDYVAYIFQQNASFATAADRIMAEARDVFIEYATTGRKSGGRLTVRTGMVI